MFKNHASLALIFAGSTSAPFTLQQQGGAPLWIWFLPVLLTVLLAGMLWWAYQRWSAVPNAPQIFYLENLPGLGIKVPVSESARARTTQPFAGPAVTAAAATTVADDNLEIVEGIGPKTAAVLRAAGITSLAALAASTAAQLTPVLKGAGLRFADPTTWPQQADLAVKGRLEELRALQDRLKVGRIVQE